MTKLHLQSSLTPVHHHFGSQARLYPEQSELHRDWAIGTGTLVPASSFPIPFLAGRSSFASCITAGSSDTEFDSSAGMLLSGAEAAWIFYPAPWTAKSRRALSGSSGPAAATPPSLSYCVSCTHIWCQFSDKVACTAICACPSSSLFEHCSIFSGGAISNGILAARLYWTHNLRVWACEMFALIATCPQTAISLHQPFGTPGHVHGPWESCSAARNNYLNRFVLLIF